MSTRKRITIADLHAACNQLCGTGRGMAALRALSKLMDEGAVTLDVENQRAFRLLVDAVWGEYTGTARDLMREAVAPVALPDVDESQL